MIFTPLYCLPFIELSMQSSTPFRSGNSAVIPVCKTINIFIYMYLVNVFIDKRMNTFFRHRNWQNQDSLTKLELKIFVVTGPYVEFGITAFGYHLVYLVEYAMDTFFQGSFYLGVVLC